MKQRLLAVAALGVLALPPLAWPAPEKARPPARPPELPPRIQRLVANERYDDLTQALLREKTSLGGRRSLLLGHAQLRRKRFLPAMDSLRKALREIPALRRYALLFLGQAALGAEKYAAARRALGELLEKGGGGPDPPLVYRSLIRIHRKEGRHLRAAKLARRYVRSFPGSRDAPYFLVREARARSAASQPREAAQVWRELWLRHPEHPTQNRTAALSPSLPRLGYKALFARARRLQKRYHFRKALRGFQDLKRRFRKSPHHERVVFHEALTLFSLRRTKQAGPALEHAIRHYPAGGARRAEARYYLARNHLRAKDQPAFESEALRLLRETPKGKWAARARYLLARVHEDDGDFPKAARHYQKVISHSPQSKQAPLARFQLAWIRFRAKDYARAHKGFSQAGAAHPAHWLASAAAYWAAAAAEKAGRRKRAIAGYRACARQHRHRYYGQQALRALRRLARAGHQAARRPLPLRRAGYREWMRPPPRSGAKLRAADLLSSMGFHEYAAREYARLGASPYFRYRAARVFTEAGEHQRAITLINKGFWDAVRAGGRDLPRAFWKMVYPLAVRHREPGGANVYLVNALIRAESAFDPRALSPAGARGLMQLMPATGRRLARKHKIPLSSANDLFRPGVNARLGARHLGALVREFGGALVPAIASYNAGRGAVKRWWRAGRGKPMEIFIEEIPYQETRTYVKRVLGYYREYRRIYGAGGRPARRRAPAQ